MIHRQANTLRRRPTVKTAAALSIFLLAMIQLAPAAAANERASGSAYQPLVCVGTYDPFSGTSECETSAVFTGTWTGHVKIHARGTADLMTGHASGVADYHLTRTAPGGPEGELFFSGPYTINGDTCGVEVNVTVTRGTGAFEGATGSARITGSCVVISGGTTIASYSGSWSHPAY